MFLFSLFPLFSYFHNLVQKLFLLGFYESAGTAGTQEQQYFTSCRPAAPLGTSFAKNYQLPLSQPIYRQKRLNMPFRKDISINQRRRTWAALDLGDAAIGQRQMTACASTFRT
jgi:hypothetical protein